MSDEQPVFRAKGADMQRTQVTIDGQVTVPKELLEQLGMGAGSHVFLDIKGNHIELRAEHETIERRGGMPQSGFGMIKSKRKAVPADFGVAALFGR
jgi:AbrB family looped-hinge helix DNA binding protein